MRCQESEEGKLDILQKTQTFLDQQTAKRSAGFHTSDVMYPRKAFFRSISPVPMTEDEVGYFISGHGIHHVVEAIEGEPNEREVEVYNKEAQVWTTVDVLHPKVVWEFKSTRKKTISRTPNETYLIQVWYECALTGRYKAKIVILYLKPEVRVRKTVNTAPRFQVFEITFTKSEIAEAMRQIKERVKLLTEAQTTGDHSKLPLCPDWLCRSCPWYDQCQPQLSVDVPA
jgi:hypothetical protein